MSFNSEVYTRGTGAASLAQFVPVQRSVNPASTDVMGVDGVFKVGQQWVNTVSGDVFELTGLTTQGGTLSARWTTLSAAGGSLNTLTGNTGGAVVPTAGNINVIGAGDISVAGAGSTLTITTSAAAAKFPITPFVVGPVGDAGYQTIQSAITAATAGTGGTVYIQPGTYTENLTLAGNVNLVGINLQGLIGQVPGASVVNINGNHTFSGSGAITLTGLTCSATTGDVFTISSSASMNALALNQCFISSSAGRVAVVGGGSAGSIFVCFGAQLNATGGPAIQLLANGQYSGASTDASSSSAQGILISGANAKGQMSQGCTVEGSTAALEIADATADVTSTGTTFSCNANPAILFSAAGRFQSYEDNFSSGAASGFYISGAGTYAYADSNAIQSAKNIDGAVTQQPQLTRPVATAGANAGASQRGTASFDSADFSVTDGFVSLSSSSTLFPITPFVVGPVGLAGYQTVQSAINAANTAGGGTVYIQHGTYNESLTLFSGVNLKGVGNEFSDVATINGEHVPPTSGLFSIEDLQLTGTGVIITSAAAGTTEILLRNIAVGLSPAITPYMLDLPSWTGAIRLENVRNNGTAADGITNAAASNVAILNCPSIGFNTTSTLLCLTLTCSNSNFVCPINLNGAGSVISDCTFHSQITFNAGATALITNSVLQDANLSPVLFNSTSVGSSQILNCVVNSPTALAVDGTGTSALELGDLNFPNFNGIAGTLTNLSWASSSTGDTVIIGSQTGQVTSVDSSMTPYTVTANDFYLSVKSSGGPITILLPTFADSVKGRHLMIEDTDGAAQTNNITVNGNGDPVVSNGLALSSQKIQTAYGVMDLTYDTNLRWVSNADAGLAARFPITPYVAGVPGQSGYLTIQSAINAAATAGGGDVYIQPGTYNEDLTLIADVNLIGIVPYLNSEIVIVGSHTPPTGSGDILLANLQFESSSQIIFSSATITCNITVLNCFCVPFTGGGAGFSFQFTSASPTAVFTTQNVQSGSNDAGYLSWSGVANFYNCPVPIGNGGSTLVNSGTAINSSFNSNFSMGGSDLYFAYKCNFFQGINIGNPSGFSGVECYIASSGTAINNGSGSGVGPPPRTSSFSNCTIDAGASPAINVQSAGAGIFLLTGLEFSGPFADIGGAGAAVPTWGTTRTGNAFFDGAVDVSSTLAVHSNATIDGNLSLVTAGDKINIAEGSGASVGLSTLVGGTVTVFSAAITGTASRVFLTSNVDGGTPGFLRVTGLAAGQFTIQSSDAGDTSEVAWWVIN